MDALLRRRLMMQAGGAPTPPTPAPVFYDKLIFDGTAYIDTDISIAASSSISCAAGGETLKAAQRIFLIGNSTDGYWGVVLGGNTSNANGRQMLPYYDSTSQLSANLYLPFSNTSYNLFLTPKRIGWGNASYTFTKGSKHPTTGLPLGCNTNHNGQNFTGWMGNVRIFDSSAQNATTYNDLISYTPIYTLRPCTYEGEAGMWCVETSTFYGNTAGAGTLTVENS